MGGLIKAIRALPAEEWRRALALSFIATLASLAFPAVALAQAVNINLGTGAGLTERVVQLIGLMTVLSLAPSIVIMTTSFVRIVVVLSLLRQALGLQQAPPNAVIISLSLFLTAIVMGPTLQRSYDEGVKPLLDQQMQLPAAFDAAAEDLHAVAGRAGGPFPVHQALQDPQAGQGAGRPDPGGHAGVHDLGAEARLRDRLPAVHSLPGHRPGGGQRADEHGHDDAAAGGGEPAVQADLLRPRRRLAAGGGQPGGELPPSPGRIAARPPSG
jgi:hypothetical protein